MDQEGFEALWCLSNGAWIRYKESSKAGKRWAKTCVRYFFWVLNFKDCDSVYNVVREFSFFHSQHQISKSCTHLTTIPRRYITLIHHKYWKSRVISPHNLNWPSKALSLFPATYHLRILTTSGGVSPLPPTKPSYIPPEPFACPNTLCNPRPYHIYNHTPPILTTTGRLRLGW
jgi:hypothetical protein